MSPSRVKALAAEHDADFLRVWDGAIPDAFSFENFPDFGRQYLFGLRLLSSNGALVTAIDGLGETPASQNVRHAELTTRVCVEESVGTQPRTSTQTVNQVGADRQS